jgi:hypothetical protein
MTKTTERRACGGVFTADPELPPDSRGRQVCRCGLVGEPGDAHHKLPDVPAQAEVRHRYGDD